MASGDSPAVARRRVRLALREAREAKSLTQGQVAEAMEWSLSKVMRIESGEVSIATNDLRPLLAYLGVVNPVRVNQLVEDAKVAKQRRDQWWEQPRYREHLTLAMRQSVHFELDASAIRYYSIPILPGVLQTPRYAEAILNTWRHELPPEDVELRLEARLRRRNQLFGRASPPVVLALLDESVLYRRAGSAEVMAEQLDDLLSCIESGKVQARVMPFATDAPLPLFGSYEIFSLGADDDLDNAVMYRESITLDEVMDDSVTVQRHRGIFDQQWTAALDERSSVRLIEQTRKSLTVSRSSGSDPPPSDRQTPG